MLGESGHPCGKRDASERLAAILEAHRLHRAAQLVDAERAVLERGLRQDDRDLIVAVPAGDVAGSKLVPQKLAELAERLGLPLPVRVWCPALRC